MNLLAIDTATERASVALSVGGHLDIEYFEGSKTHAQLVLPAVASLFDRAGITLSALDGIVFGEGPGSFTGLRVACSIVKGLAYGQDLPLYPVSTLAAIAASVKQPDGDILAVIDARMNQLYWSYFPRNHTASIPVVSNVPDIVLPGSSPICLVGTGWERYEDQWPLASQQRFVQRQAAYPDAGVMIDLVKKGGIAAVSVTEAMPVYVRNDVTS